MPGGFGTFRGRFDGVEVFGYPTLSRGIVVSKISCVVFLLVPSERKHQPLAGCSKKGGLRDLGSPSPESPPSA